MIGKCSSRDQPRLFLCLTVYDSLSRNKNSERSEEEFEEWSELKKSRHQGLYNFWRWRWDMLDSDPSSPDPSFIPLHSPYVIVVCVALSDKIETSFQLCRQLWIGWVTFLLLERNSRKIRKSSGCPAELRMNRMIAQFGHLLF